MQGGIKKVPKSHELFEYILNKNDKIKNVSRVIDHVEHGGVVHFEQLLRVNQIIAINCKCRKISIASKLAQWGNRRC